MVSSACVRDSANPTLIQKSPISLQEVPRLYNESDPSKWPKVFCDLERTGLEMNRGQAASCCLVSKDCQCGPAVASIF